MFKLSLAFFAISALNALFAFGALGYNPSLGAQLAFVIFLTLGVVALFLNEFRKA